MEELLLYIFFPRIDFCGNKNKVLQSSFTLKCLISFSALFFRYLNKIWVNHLSPVIYPLPYPPPPLPTLARLLPINSVYET